MFVSNIFYRLDCSVYVLFGVQDKPNQTGEKGLIFIHVEDMKTQLTSCVEVNFLSWCRNYLLCLGLCSDSVDFLITSQRMSTENQRPFSILPFGEKGQELSYVLVAKLVIF